MSDIDKFAKEGVFKILVGNKCDLIDKRQVTKERGKQLADSYGIPFIEKQLKLGNAGFTKKVGPSSAAVNLSSTKIEDAPKKKKCC